MKNHYLNKSVFNDLIQLVLISAANGLMIGSVLILLVMMLSGPAGAAAPAFPII